MAGPPDFDSGAFVAEGQQRIDNQKKALLDVIAQQGQAGAATYAQGQAQINTYGDNARQTAMANQAGSAISDPGYAGAEEGRRQSMLNMYRADMTAGSTSFASDMARQAAAGGQYMSEASASLPSVAAGVQRDIEGIKGKIEEERQRRAHEAQMREMAMQAQREEMQFAREKMAADRAAAEKGEDEDPRVGWERERQESRQMKTEIDQYVDGFSAADKSLYDAIFRGLPVPVPHDKQHLRELAAKDKANKARLARFYDEAPAE